MDAVLRAVQPAWMSSFAAWLRRTYAFYVALGAPTDEDRQW